MGARVSRWFHNRAPHRRKPPHGSPSATSHSGGLRSKNRSKTSLSKDSFQSASVGSTSWFSRIRKKGKNEEKESIIRVRDPSQAPLRRVTEVSAEIEEPTPVFSPEGRLLSKSEQKGWRQRLANAFKRKKTKETQPVEGVIPKEHALVTDNAVTEDNVVDEATVKSTATTATTTKTTATNLEAISEASAVSSTETTASETALSAAVAEEQGATSETVRDSTRQTGENFEVSVTISLTTLLSSSSSARRSTSDLEEIGKWSADLQQTALEKTTKKEREFLTSYFSKESVRKRRKKRK